MATSVKLYQSNLDPPGLGGVVHVLHGPVMEGFVFPVSFLDGVWWFKVVAISGDQGIAIELNEITIGEA